MSYSTTVHPTLAKSVEVCVGMAINENKIKYEMGSKVGLFGLR
jgi:hypothetical protein